MDKPSLKVMAEELEKVPGIVQALVWDRVTTRARIYLDLKKFNRERCWNLGAGRRIVVFPTGLMAWEGAWAGAMTRDWHKENKTWMRVERAVSELLGDSPMSTPGRTPG